MSVPIEDEGSFAAGRQALLEALKSLEERAHDRAERMVRDAERSARQLTLESEQRAYQVTSEAEERARQTLADAEQRSRQVTIEAAQRMADLEQQLTEIRDNLEAARIQLQEQVVSVRGQVEVARASLNTVRERLTTGGGRLAESRMNIPALSSDRAPVREEVAPPPELNDLRAMVDRLKKPVASSSDDDDALEAAADASEPNGEADEASESEARARS